MFLIGFMGAGKTSVARRVARDAGIASVDLDTFLERRVGRRIKDIFAEDGEEGFRAIETDLLEELASKDDPLLVSCGGGIITQARNCAILAERGLVVHLRVDADEAASRISDMSSRPLFQDIEAARRRCAERLPQYEAAADLTIDTAGKSIAVTAGKVFHALKERGVLCQRPE